MRKDYFDSGVSQVSNTMLLAACKYSIEQTKRKLVIYSKSSTRNHLFDCHGQSVDWYDGEYLP